jgi:hypothetical protein
MGRRWIILEGGNREGVLTAVSRGAGVWGFERLGCGVKRRCGRELGDDGARECNDHSGAGRLLTLPVVMTRRFSAPAHGCSR